MNTKELFQALEFAHYAERFRDKIFVVAFPLDVPFQELLLDIKVLAGYHIKVVLVVPDPEFRLEELIAVSNKRGTRFHLTLVTDALYQPDHSELAIDLKRLRRVLDAGGSVIMAHHSEPAGREAIEPTFALAGAVAERMGADKLFLVGRRAHLMEDALNRTHVTREELEHLTGQLTGGGDGGGSGGVGAEADFGPLLAYIAAHLDRGVPDIVLLDGLPTHLFREVFTHDGAGILFNTVRRALIRQAQVRDTTDIALLLRPEIDAGRILPVDENVIERHIADFWIYEVDGLLVGVARLKRYGRWAELAHFSTLPRYRGKGRARELALSMIRQAAGMRTEAVFALSVDPRMWEFFQSLGFNDTAREQLPQEWRAQYDFTRPSHAFVKELP